MRFKENQLIAEAYAKVYEAPQQGESNKHAALVRELNAAFPNIFSELPLDHIDYSIEMARKDDEDRAPVMMEYIDDNMGNKIQDNQKLATQIETKLYQIASKYADFITTEIVSAGYGYEFYLVFNA